MTRSITTLAAATLALAATGAGAQMPPQERGMGMGPNREAMRAAYEACKDKPDRRACMTEQMCAKAQDPAKCQAQAKARGEKMQQRVEARQKMHEACSGKRGEDLANCMKGQRQAMMQQRMEERQKAHEACNGRRGDELMNCLREQSGKSGMSGPGRRG